MLSQDAIIAVASLPLIVVLAICSIVFFVFGYFCGHHRKLQDKNSVARSPEYEDVPSHHRIEDLELNSNIAYAKHVIR